MHNIDKNVSLVITCNSNAPPIRVLYRDISYNFVTDCSVATSLPQCRESQADSIQYSQDKRGQENSKPLCIAFRMNLPAYAFTLLFFTTAIFATECSGEKVKCESDYSWLTYAVGGGLVAVVAPFALPAVGFTSAGVAAGSWAASVMSSAAVANGGAIAAGSLVATLQGVAATGVGVAGTVGLASTGAAVGAGVKVAVDVVKGAVGDD
ncbi:uncharacterized protein LOC122248263 [Penaeus japonicus]|uniref:uncharacterized protein LOC122248263 n=1 Tax=Penaeus japonicus TaxID=27405 RepID=UPI001C70EEC6|nr:uncharacterized protein LOC122248263 [Penaeus japonicus]